MLKYKLQPHKNVNPSNKNSNKFNIGIYFPYTIITKCNSYLKIHSLLQNA